jgi:tetratricopeptide (TPR) repeat protein
MSNPSEKTINNILINNLENNTEVNNKLIEYYLDNDNIKLALYYSKKNTKLTDEFTLITHAKLFLKLKKDDNAIKLLKRALFEYNSESAFYLLKNLYYKKHIKIDNFIKVIKKGVEINPYLINYYYSILVKDDKTNKKELFEQYLSYSDELKLSKDEFKNINLTQIEKIYYLEKIITKNNYKWAKELYKKILYKNPYLLNLRRLQILSIF